MSDGAAAPRTFVATWSHVKNAESGVVESGQSRRRFDVVRRNDDVRRRVSAKPAKGTHLGERSAAQSRGGCSYKTGRGRRSRSVAERAARRTDGWVCARGCGTYACYALRTDGRRTLRVFFAEEQPGGAIDRHATTARGFNMSMKVSVESQGAAVMVRGLCHRDFRGRIFFPPFSHLDAPRICPVEVAKCTLCLGLRFLHVGYMYEGGIKLRVSLHPLPPLSCIIVN